MKFNQTNFDRLVHLLQTMPPDDFSYISAWMHGEPGCVACQCRHLDAAVGSGALATDEDIADFLGVTALEAEYLYSGSISDDPYPGVFRGEKGIANALHRLHVVAAKYARPVISVNSGSFNARDRAFVQRCMETASQPLAEEVE